MYTMLTQQQAQILAQEHQTIVDNVIKEHYQIYLLDHLFKSSFEDSLIFKGGTTLRLAYNSVRFSEDLDFSLLKDINFDEFKQSLNSFIKLFSEAKIQDVYNKRSTIFAKIVFNVNFKPIPTGIKIEINKNSRNFHHTVALTKSPFNNLELSSRVYTLESILADKINILDSGSRRQPRDLFDAWYISQKLNQEFIIKNEYKYSSKELMDNLNPLLPRNYAKVMELFKKI